MNCNECREKLSDFLLDELPESEAVLVQEHLSLCPECMSIYKELKGTGRALEAVPAMNVVAGSEEWRNQVKDLGREESEKIIRLLPPDKRARAEMRRAARLSQARPPATSQRMQKRGGMFTVIALIVAGLAIVAAILLYPMGGTSREPVQVATLALCMGKVSQFYQRAGEPWSPAQQGKTVLTGDAYSTGADGRARFDLGGGGAVFAGPDADLKFQRPESEGKDWILRLDAGEAGVELPEGPSVHGWTVVAAAVEVRVRPGARVYLNSGRGGNGAQCTVYVSKGGVQAAFGRGKGNQEVSAGQAAVFYEDSKLAPTSDAADATVPGWRADLLTETEVKAFFTFPVKIKERRAAGLLVELNLTPAPEHPSDWTVESGKRGPMKQTSGALLFPADSRALFTAPLDPPMTLELDLAPETPKEAGLALTLFESAAGRVNVDLDRVAQLTVRDKDHARSEKVSARTKPNGSEALKLEASASAGDYAIVVTTNSGSTKPLLLPHGLENGAFSIRGVGDSAYVERLRIVAVLPRAWLRKKLSGE